MRRLGVALVAAVLLAACAPAAALPPGSSAPPSPTVSATATPFSAPSDAPPPSPLPSGAALGEPAATPEATPLPGTTPFPTPGPTITPGSTRVIGTILHADGSPAAGVCVILEKGICPIATDANGAWFTDIPAGPINWNFIYKVDGQEAGRQFLLGSDGGELRLPAFTLTG